MTTPDTDPATGLPIGPRIVDPSPAPGPQRTTLTGRYVSVTALDPVAHADSLYATTSGPENERLWLYLFDGPFTSRAEFDAYLTRIASVEDRLYYAILDNTSGRAVGHACYLRIEPAQRCIEVGGILYTPTLQRTPGATEAMYLMARYVFEDMGYRRYEWKCHALNAPSRRAALRLGFTYEGVFRQHMIMKGRNRDTAWFSMLDSEWPARKAAFEQWLDPANFDVDGRQKISLSALNDVDPESRFRNTGRG
ncbi:MAG TPA: GNAT family protein [Ktedonobacterales bacterium]|jgi:RimJ/RimL family protein N-acetyltransferase